MDNLANVNVIKIYFINPIDLISVLINTLINLEYEAYTVTIENREKLIRLLKEADRNIVFICIRSKQEVHTWLEYNEKIKKHCGDNTFVNAFVFDNIDEGTEGELIDSGISIEKFSQLKENALAVLRNLLAVFGGRGRRQFIRTKAYGESKAYFYLQGLEEPIVGKINDISAYAFSCSVHEYYRSYFEPGSYIAEVTLVLRGLRIKSALKIIGFHRDNSSTFIMKFCQAEFFNGKNSFVDEISKDNKKKIHEYIKKCLKDDLTEKLEGN